MVGGLPLFVHISSSMRSVGMSHSSKDLFVCSRVFFFPPSESIVRPSPRPPVLSAQPSQEPSHPLLLNTQPRTPTPALGSMARDVGSALALFIISAISMDLFVFSLGCVSSVMGYFIKVISSEHSQLSNRLPRYRAYISISGCKKTFVVNHSLDQKFRIKLY